MISHMTDLEALPTRALDYIKQLEARIDAQEQTIASQASELAHNRKIFETASVAAKIGVWECTLPDETLYWSDGVYDLFDLPRGADITRSQILRLYPKEERLRLNDIRSQAIKDRTGFTTEIEIISAKGRHRWIRLSATVECNEGVPVRIFGIKQDITEERSLLDRTRYLAEFDVLTGLANRSQFQRRLSRLDPTHPDYCPISALLLVDIDKFKEINDTFGHILGDQCLVETAKHLRTACPAAELIARIGGDEFAVLLRPGLDKSTVNAIGRLIVTSLVSTDEMTLPRPKSSVSVGAAEFVGQNSSDLFIQADSALYAAKKAGRNTFRAYEPDVMMAADASKSAA